MKLFLIGTNGSGKSVLIKSLKYLYPSYKIFNGVFEKSLGTSPTKNEIENLFIKISKLYFINSDFISTQSFYSYYILLKYYELTTKNFNDKDIRRLKIQTIQKIKELNSGLNNIQYIWLDVLRKSEISDFQKKWYEKFIKSGYLKFIESNKIKSFNLSERLHISSLILENNLIKF